jgi:hypothetical protein
LEANEERKSKVKKREKQQWGENKRKGTQERKRSILFGFGGVPQSVLGRRKQDIKEDCCTSFKKICAAKNTHSNVPKKEI